MTSGLRSGELAGAAGVHIQTLRYYERRGLLDPPRRSPGGHRLYPLETVSVLKVIKAAQRLGFSLDEVSDLLRAGRRRHVSGALHERAVVKLAEIDERLAQLGAIRAALADVVAARCDSLTDCTCADCPLPEVRISPAGGSPSADRNGGDQRQRHPAGEVAERRAG